MIGALVLAFAAGVLSLVTPCVLPLVPGYLSAAAAVDPAQLGRAGSARRVVLGSVPFFAGFTVVFVALGLAAAAVVGVVGKDAQEQLAGILLVVFGFAFMGLLPLPKRVVAPGLLGGARRSGSGVLLGAAFAVCAAPCIGGILGSVLVLGGEGGDLGRGALLLAGYSLGLASGFVLAGVAFTRAMSAFRWLRARWVALQVVSGALLVALGLLLFFDRDWWLRVLVNRALGAFGA